MADTYDKRFSSSDALGWTVEQSIYMYCLWFNIVAMAKRIENSSKLSMNEWVYFQ